MRPAFGSQTTGLCQQGAAGAQVWPSPSNPRAASHTQLSIIIWKLKYINIWWPMPLFLDIYFMYRYRYNMGVQFLWNSFYQKSLLQQNGDMRKRDLHAFKLHLEQGRALSPLPPPHPLLTVAIRGGRLALCFLPPPLFRLNLCDFQRSRPKARTASI